jgi:hypothetical protein
VAADKQRGRQTARDMVLSLGVILLAAGVIYLFVPHDTSQNPVKPVSYRVELTSARRGAPYPVVAPAGLSAKWRATSVRYSPDGEQGATWHLGFMTPDNQYAAVEQSSSPHPAGYVHQVTQGAHKTARTERIGGATWTRYAGVKYDALVRQEPGKRPAAASEAGAATGVTESAVRKKDLAHTTVVTGTASPAQLRQLAAALRPGSAGGSGEAAQAGADGKGAGRG